jgi:probable rRNA maturation factor
MSLVRFSYADVSPIVLKSKRAVKDFVVEIFQVEGRPVRELTYIFCSDEYLLDINQSFLKHDDYTDIITFDLSEGPETVGEIYISIERVIENAVVHGELYARELLRVIFHGALHLIGYRDKKKSEITIMREKEEYYLRLFECK